MRAVIAGLLCWMISTDAWAQLNNIVPAPVKVVLREGSFPLSKATAIIADNVQAGTARYLRNYLDKYYVRGIAITNNGKGSKIILQTDSTAAEEAYTLNIEPGIVRITGGNAGVFYGVQSLLQCLPAPASAAVFPVPCGMVKDQPRFAWRGLSLDVSRHFFDVAEVKKYIDVMAHYKLNRFHWHLTDDEGWRIQIDRYPELTATGSRMYQWAKEGKFRPLSNILEGGNGGYYTKDEIRQVIQYAAERFVTVVPEIEMPGHSEAAIYTYPELGCSDSTYKPTPQPPFHRVRMLDPSEQTFTFLQNVLTEVMALFPGPYLHIGGDEADMDDWLKSPVAVALMKREGLKDPQQVQSYFIKRVEKIVNAGGKKMIGWDEIIKGGLAPTATVMSWTGEEGGITAARMQHPVIMTPVEYLYFDAPQGDVKKEPKGWNDPITWQQVYNYNPVPAVLTESDTRNILGAQANIWTELIATPQHLEYMVYPRALALAEICWTPLSGKDINTFEKRMQRQYQWLHLWQINARPFSK